MRATLRETPGLKFTVIDEYGDTWTQVAADGRGNLAVQRDTGPKWEAREFTVRGLFVDGAEGDLWGPKQEGDDFRDHDGTIYVATRRDNAGSIRWVERED